jgi:hypothetical protein
MHSNGAEPSHRGDTSLVSEHDDVPLREGDIVGLALAIVELVGQYSMIVS